MVMMPVAQRSPVVTCVSPTRSTCGLPSRGPNAAVSAMRSCLAFPRQAARDHRSSVSSRGSARPGASRSSVCSGPAQRSCRHAGRAAQHVERAVNRYSSADTTTSAHGRLGHLRRAQTIAVYGKPPPGDDFARVWSQMRSARRMRLCSRPSACGRVAQSRTRNGPA